MCCVWWILNVLCESVFSSAATTVSIIFSSTSTSRSTFIGDVRLIRMLRINILMKISVKISIIVIVKCSVECVLLFCDEIFVARSL